MELNVQVHQRGSLTLRILPRGGNEVMTSQCLVLGHISIKGTVDRKFIQKNILNDSHLKVPASLYMYICLF